MKYEVIGEKFDRFDEPIVCINQFNSASDALAVLKVAIFHGSVGEVDKDVSELTLDDALEILSDALANDGADCVYRITNLTTKKVLFDETESDEDMTEEYDREYEDWLEG